MRRLTEEQSELLITRYKPPRTVVKWKRGRWRRRPGPLRWQPAGATQLQFDQFEILSPYPDTPFRALVFLHECAHIANGDWRHEHAEHHYEYAAEMTAMAWWRAEGYKVPKAYIRTSKKYIRSVIASDRRKKGKRKVRIKPHVVRWANSRV